MKKVAATGHEVRLEVGLSMGYSGKELCWSTW